MYVYIYKLSKGKYNCSYKQILLCIKLFILHYNNDKYLSRVFLSLFLYLCANELHCKSACYIPYSWVTLLKH